MGYRFRLHRRDLPGTPDLVLPRRRAVIFVNGCFWHWHPDPRCAKARLPKSNVGFWIPKLTKNRSRDRDNTVALEQSGWRVLTIWECELGDLDRVMTSVYEFPRPIAAGTSTARRATERSQWSGHVMRRETAEAA